MTDRREFDPIFTLLISKFDDLKEDIKGDIREVNDKLKDVKNELKEHATARNESTERLIKVETTLNNGLKTAVLDTQKEVKLIGERLIRVEYQTIALDTKITNHIDDEIQQTLKQVYTVNPNDPDINEPESGLVKITKLILDNWLKAAAILGITIAIIIITVTTGHLPDWLIGMIQ